MTSATNVEATAVGTIEWLSQDSTTIVVPVYQRQYRWDIGGCEQLLGDIRAVADEDDAHRHFLGSILSARESSPTDADLILIDGQQRITTLMLLIAALHHSVRESDPEMAAELRRVLVRADDPDRTKLRPHHAWAELYESVVLERDESDRESRFDDNYAFFRSQVHADEAPRIWRGLQRLEHVSITLGAAANAQQIFESLNSTGEPLRDHELIHNYVLMGLSHAEQLAIEEEYWLPIERATGETIGTFWRHYLVMTTGREVAAAGEHGVYSAFRQSFPRFDLERLRSDAAIWREYAEIYRILLDPSLESDAGIRRQLAFIGTFGRAAFPSSCASTTITARERSPATTSSRCSSGSRRCICAARSSGCRRSGSSPGSAARTRRAGMRSCARSHGSPPRTSGSAPCSSTARSRIRPMCSADCSRWTRSTASTWSTSSRSHPATRGPATGRAHGPTSARTSRTVIAHSRRRSAT
ncbi:DUF262 domain-containing protein [Microbacterium sp. NIBRBAC000506063]|uniref:DUF262 domain-containing protein n=1 Tax=Microbacterium sp. NIBRBAC000506063 TaxID=2734618 RepID=UPI001CB74406|nr:DUF262 domain-containing protein [Microbacterium sp. NIBRBAC000506063]